MATITKAGTGTVLSTNTSWTGNVTPGSISGQSDTAIWISTSLGGALTGSLGSPERVTISISSATANISHSAGTIYTSYSGINFYSSNTRNWTETGTIDVGSADQPWFLSTGGSTTAAILLNSATALTGSASIFLLNNTALLNSGYAWIYAAGACSGFTGNIVLTDYTQIAPGGVSSLTNANIQIDGVGCNIMPSNASGDVLGSASGRLIFNNNAGVGIGSPARSWTIAYPVSFHTDIAGYSVVIPSSGSNTFTQSIGTLSSLNYPSNYVNNMDGHTIFSGIPNIARRIVGTIYTESGYDFIRIYDGSGIGGTLLYSLSGNSVSFDWTSSVGQTFTVRFSSDSIVTSTGFSLSVIRSYTQYVSPYSVVIPSSGSNTFTQSSGTLSSFNYPSQYVNNMDGHTIFSGIPNIARRIVGTINTETNWDYIRIYDGSGIGGTLLYSLSGYNVSFDWTSSVGQTFTVRFSSDTSVTSTGFSLSVIDPDVGYFNLQDSNTGLRFNTEKTITINGTTTFSNTINFGSLSHIINTAAATTFSSTLSGSSGFSKSGSSTLTISGSSHPSLFGDININAGSIILSSTLQTGNTIPGVNFINLNSTTSSIFISSNAAYTLPNFPSGTGSIIFECTNSSGITIPPGVLSRLDDISSDYGLGIHASASTSYLNINDFSRKLSYMFTGANPTANITYSRDAAQTYSGAINLDTRTNIISQILASGTITASFINNSTSSDAKIVLSGPISRLHTSATVTTVLFSLAGTNTGNNEVSGIISESGAAGLTAFSKVGTGKWILSGSNTYTGANTLTAGTLECRSASALGASSSSSSTTLTAGTLQISGGIIINKLSSSFQCNGSTIQNLSGSNALTASNMIMNSSFAITSTSGSLNIRNTILTGATTQTLTINGPGTVRLSNDTSSYVSITNITSGTLEVTKISNFGSNSSIGAPATGQATITMGSGGSTTLSHIGSTDSSTNRPISFAGAAGTKLTLDSSGSGALDFNSSGTLAFTVAGIHTLELSGTNTGLNYLARTIADSTGVGGGATSIVKSGSGTWYITGSITATGSITVSGGTLNLGSTNRTLTGNISITDGATLTNTSGNTISSNLTMGWGTFNSVLTGAKTLTVSTSATEAYPATINPNATNGSNSMTGSVTINGCADLVPDVDVGTAGYGRVLGTSNTVTVAGTGMIRTKDNTDYQRGRARYNNLTFNSGATLKIGFAK